MEAGLVRAAAATNTSEVVNYIKPLQCGGSDESFVLRNDSRSQSGIKCQTLFSWDTPASPHLASRWENLPVSDNQVLNSLTASMELIKTSTGDNKESTTIIETAGGALSPSSSSPENKSSIGTQWGWSTQADLYSPLQIPAVFVGDGKLGGISVSLSTLEALWNRGYRVDAVVFIDQNTENGDSNKNDDAIRFGEGNAEALKEYITMQRSKQTSQSKNVQHIEDDAIVVLPSLPPMPDPLGRWYEENHNEFIKLHWLLNNKWQNYFS